MVSRFRARPSHLRRRLAAVLVSLGAVLLAGAAQAADVSVGFMPGPHRDAFARGVEPQFKKLGYTVRYVEFSQGVQPKDAVERGQIDAGYRLPDYFSPAK